MWLHSSGYSAAAVHQLPQVAWITQCNVLQVPTQQRLAGMQSQSDCIMNAVAAALSVAAAAGGGPCAAAAPQQREYKDLSFNQWQRGEDLELLARQLRQQHLEVQLSHWRLGARDRQSEGAVLPVDQWRVPKPFISMFISQLT